jgi:catechol 2,3-dioxygenase-like lactoylglutathione lyase family enzyme
VHFRPGIGSLEIGVTDLERSLAFYQGLLGFAPDQDSPPGDGAWLRSGSVRLHLVPVGEGADLGGWEGDDLQRGIRHAGFTVGDVDRQAERLRDAGVRFTLEPLDAVGDVRIAFFPDPDGALLEIVQGHLHYTRTFSPSIAAREARAAAARLPEAGLAFDHVAVTVEDLDAALAAYRDELGFEVIGQLDQTQDPRGFRISYLQAGDAVLEVFSFAAPTRPGPEPGLPGRAGHRRVELTAADGGEVRLDRDAVPARVGTPGTPA